jgi:RNA polymerase sigma-70 factor, ECF subfamily
MTFMINDADSSLRKLNDWELIQRILKDRVNAFEILLERYRDHVFSIAGKNMPLYQVEDVAHDIFINAYRSLGSFKNKGPFRHWLSKIAIRTCYDHWRKAYRNREIPMSTLCEEHQSWIHDILSGRTQKAYEGSNHQKEAAELLAWALERLSPENRIVLQLTYLDGLSAKEAADVLGWSKVNVKVRAFRSRRKLKEILAKIIDGRRRAI